MSHPPHSQPPPTGLPVPLGDFRSVCRPGVSPHPGGARPAEYLVECERSENVPEPGAPCRGSGSDTEADVEAESENGPEGEPQG